MFFWSRCVGVFVALVLWAGAVHAQNFQFWPPQNFESARGGLPKCQDGDMTVVRTQLNPPGIYCQKPAAAAPSTCSLPWGGLIADGQSVTAWNASSSCGGCSSQTRTCSNGSLSGSFTFSSCTTSCTSCNLPWGGSISHGQSVTAWNTSSSCGGCSPQTRTCSNGSLSGSFTFSSCTTSCTSCNLPWGGSIAHGQSVVAFRYGSEEQAYQVGVCHESQYRQTRTCSNGSLSGSYQYGSCQVAPDRGGHDGPDRG